MLLSLAKSTASLEEFLVDGGCGGVVGVVEEHHFGAFGIDGFEVRYETVLLQKRHGNRCTVAEDCTSVGVHGVTWVRNQNSVARVDECAGNVCDAFF